MHVDQQDLRLTKQLSCLREIAMIVEREQISLDEILRSITTIISKSLLSIENCSIEIVVEQALYRSGEFVFSEHSCEFPIEIENKRYGSLRVYTDAITKDRSSSCFKDEDLGFIYYLCERIGRITQRYRLSAELERAKTSLIIKNNLLENKYIALKELIDHIAADRNQKEKEVRIHIDTIIKPIFSKMKTSDNPKEYHAQLERAIDNLTSRFNMTLKYRYSNLTKREREICNYIKDGLSSKEIAHLQNVSEQTISKHRAHIRKKFNIDHKNQNLTEFLGGLTETPD